MSFLVEPTNQRPDEWKNEQTVRSGKLFHQTLSAVNIPPSTFGHGRESYKRTLKNGQKASPGSLKYKYNWDFLFLFLKIYCSGTM